MLKCISAMKTQMRDGEWLKFAEGDTVTDPEVEAFLLRASPLSFEKVGDEPASKALDAPPTNKAILEPKETKDSKETKPPKGEVMTSDNTPGLVKGK